MNTRAVTCVDAIDKRANERNWSRLMAATIRKLRNADRDDIMEISKHVWEGHDYVPSVINQWLKDSKSHSYGVEIDGHVVALGNLRLIEDGRIGWMEGLRVHPEFRGRGFATDITRHIVKTAEHLRVERLRYTTSDENAASLKLAKMAGFSRLLRMVVSWYHKPKEIPTPSEYPSIRKRSPGRTCSLLKTNPSIIPRGILVYDWKALNDTCQNLEDIGENHIFHIALKRRKIDSLSLGSRGQDPNEPYWSFTIYATDSCGFLSQLSHNVAIALKNDLDTIMCTFETRFEKTLNDADMKSEEHQKTHIVLLEKQMHLRKDVHNALN
jgi:RimJ/RimL family protein N-acetyltransferase